MCMYESLHLSVCVCSEAWQMHTRVFRLGMVVVSLCASVSEKERRVTERGRKKGGARERGGGRE